MSENAAWLITWNPCKWKWEDYSDCLAEMTLGRTIIHDWTCINRHVQLGERVYLEVLGNNVTKGIIASGYVRREPYYEKTWKGTLGYKIEVEFDTLLQIEDALPQETLKSLFPETHWSTQASGIEIRPSKTGYSLEKVWREHVSKVLPLFNSVTRPAK